MKKTIKLVGDVGGINNAYNKILDGVWLESELAGLTSEDEIEFIIHSFGGSVFEGQYMYNLLKKCPAQKVAHVYGSCMSMATILSMACDKIYMCENSMYMIHKASIGAYGNEYEFDSILNALKGIDSIAIDNYSKRTKLPKERLISEFMTGFDKWLTPKEALEFGFIDEIKDPVQEVIESSNYSEYEYEFNIYFEDAANVDIKERPLILNKFITNPHTKMENTTKKDLENPKVVATSEATDMIAALTLELDNHKQIIKSKETEISNLSNKVTELQKEKDDAILASQNEVRKAKEDLEKVSNSIAEKDVQIYKQEVVNRVNLAVAKIQVNGKALENDKQKELSKAFRDRRNCVIEGEKESVIDRYSNEVVGDSIEAALRHYAKEGGYVPTQMQGINASANLTSNNFSFNTAQNSVNEEKAILKKQKELNKEGFSDYSKPYVAAMLAEFGNSENPHIQALKKMNF